MIDLEMFSKYIYVTFEKDSGLRDGKGQGNRRGLYVHCINVQHIEVECIKWFQ